MRLPEEEVLQDLLEVSEIVLGQKAVSMLKRRVKEKNLSRLSEIVFELAQEVQDILGERGSYATMRQIGREVANKLSKQHPPEDREQIFRIGLRMMGFAEGIGDQEGFVYIQSCVFYPNFLEPRGLSPLQHCVCYGGVGFIEGFLNLLEEKKGIEWVKREDNKCFFKA